MHDTFGQTFVDFITKPIQNYKKYKSLYKFDDVDLDEKTNSPDILWALRDVSFEIKEDKGQLGRILHIFRNNK